ncbi:MAG: hypothetical protein BMS9Abin12_0162 [Acidimicrobiia bacterium]|nr:MAG: hypothetical protein BMS9Abin12_0162 [Acidimicrobiia bacterium]
MTTLDTLARNSAQAIHISVADVSVPIPGIAAAAQAAAIWRMAVYAVAGTTVGAVILLALLVAGPSVEDPTQDFAPTTNAVVPTTIPEEPVVQTKIPESSNSEPIVPVPEGDSEEHEVSVVDTTPPPLEVTSPEDGAHLKTKIVTFSGITEPDASVTASGKFEALVDSNGSWSVDLVLFPGANGVVFRALDPAGNESQARLTVHLDVEPPTVTTTTTVAEWGFTATQQYGSCSEPIPYDVFSGIAKPGTTVSITSPYGGGTTPVDGNGKWSVKIEFPTAPYNEQFTVTVKDYAGVEKTFPFVSLYAG